MPAVYSNGSAIRSQRTKLISKSDFAERMKKISEDKNLGNEDQHIKADKLMCRVLRQSGYGKGIEIYNQLNKFYA